MSFAVNLLIMLGWAVVTGDFSSSTLVFGFLVGFAALWVARGLFGDQRYHARVAGAFRLVGFFLYDLFTSSIAVAWDILTPTLRARPCFLEMPLDARTDVEIMLTANLISLTPGTLSVDVSPDRRTLLVHAMFADDPEAVIAGLKDGMERRVLEALR
jgi:multicomponent Na+:H+ antiporter subunit E